MAVQSAQQGLLRRGKASQPHRAAGLGRPGLPGLQLAAQALGAPQKKAAEPGVAARMIHVCHDTTC